MGYVLTKNQAELIKVWRCYCEYSWRKVASMAAEVFPELDVNSGDQIDGMQLCDAAQKFFDEPTENGWN